MSKIDYANAGNDGGVVPDDFIPWRWVLSYTVHPELLTPAKLGQERRFVVSVVRKVADGQDPGYADLYKRAATIAKARASRVQSAVPDSVLHTPIVAQGWFTHPKVNLARVFITLCAVYLREGEAGPQGLMPPMSADLAKQGGMTPDNSALPPEQVKHRVYETYTFGDHGERARYEYLHRILWRVRTNVQRN